MSRLVLRVSSICTCVGASTMQKGRSTHQPFSCSVLCEEAYFASLPAICDASIQRRSARARRIYACTTDRDKQPHRSALASARRPCRRDAARTNRAHARSCARKLTSRVSPRSVTHLYRGVALVLAVVSADLASTVSEQSPGIGKCALVRPCVPCVSRLPPVSFYWQ